MTPFDEAQRAIGDACSALPSAYVPLAESAGAVVARDIIAREDLVPFARSAMDGYALFTGDLIDLPRAVPIAGAAFAAPGRQRHEPGTATAIATGAAIPAGADCVVPFEEVAVRDGSIVVSHEIAPGTCVFPPGDDARRGELLVARAEVLTPAKIALLAAAGIVRVETHRRPVVAIICGGDELVGIHETPGYGQIRDSNGIMLATALAAAGAEIVPPVRLPDRRELVRDALLTAFAVADLVVTTGGASVGERDFVKSVCADLGVRFLFRSVALRPAKPTGFGERNGRFVAVLPGNPAAAFVGLQEFVAPAVRALAGHAQPWLPRIRATLRGTISAKPSRHFAAFAAVSFERSGVIATPLDNQCSSLTRTAASGAGFIVVPPGPALYRDGDDVNVDIFDWAQTRSGVAATPCNRVHAPA